MSSDAKTSFDLELNPFERSFATKDQEQEARDVGEKVASDSNNDPKSGGNSTNKHNLHIPNLSNLGGLPQKIPGITPPFLTPGGRRLPPLGLSPGGNMAIATPGGTLWNSLLNATNNTNNNTNMVLPEDQQASFNNGNGANTTLNYNQIVNNSRKSGLTPKESNIRTGLTPGSIGSANGFNFNGQLMGLTTPSGLLNSPMTPGLSSLLGLTGTSQTLIPNGQQNGATIIQQQHVAEQAGKEPRPEPESKRSAPRPMGNKEEKEETRKRSSPSATANKSKRQRVTAASKKINNQREESVKKEADSEDDSRKPATEDEKRKHFLERNRLAASKCRQRKKQLVQKMEDELRFYSSGYRELSSQINQMRDQLVAMRNIISSHKDCPMLANMVGGYEQLTNILRQTEYVAHVTEKSAVNMSSIPSTIPTSLNSTNDPYQVPLAPTSNVHHQLPLTDTHHSGTTSVDTVSNYNNMANASTISSHHSMTDLTSAPQNNTHPNNITNSQQPQASDLRTINSLSNLTALAQPKQMNMNNNINLRTINSMVDLQHNGMNDINRSMMDLATHNG